MRKLRKGKSNNIKNIIISMSGKGGVGKSTIAVNIATILYKMEYRVGLLDCDITGPNVPKMMSLETAEPQARDKLYPVAWPVMSHKRSPKLKVFSVAFLLPTQDTPVLKRGDFKTRIIADSLSKIGWGTLDYLVLDTPPGTSDEIITVFEYLEEMKLINKSYAVIVTQPSQISQLDVIKAITLIKQFRFKKAGILVNMTGLYPGDVSYTSRKYKIPIIGRIPFEPWITASSDIGRPFTIDSDSGTFPNIVKKIIRKL